MRRIIAGVVSLALAASWPAGYAQAFTSKQKAAPLFIGASGVTAVAVLTPPAVVDQGISPDVGSPLDFGVGANDIRNSDESLRISVRTNLAANRLLIYTDNLNGSANPKFCSDTSLGNDGGGLVGLTDCKETVPLVWAVTPTNTTSYNFGTTTVGDNEVYVTDLAHVATFVDAVLGSTASTAEKQKLDTLSMRECISGAAVANATNAGTQTDPYRYPQFFGVNGADKDLCNNGSAITITSAAGVATNISSCQGLTPPCPVGSVVIGGVTYPTGSKIPFAEELSKNIGVVAFNCGPVPPPGTGSQCSAPNLATPSPTDVISLTSATSTVTFYMPLAADFRAATGQNFGTSTLTLELVTQ